MASVSRKTFEIVKSGKKDVLDVDGKILRFNKRGVTTTDDAGVAAAVEQKYGYKNKTGDGSAVVIPLEAYNEHRDRTVKRTYYFTNPAMPWAKYDALGRRVKEQ